MKTYYAFLLTFFASLSTFIGGLILLFNFNLIPSSFLDYKFIPKIIYKLIFINIGVLISILFDSINKEGESLENLGLLTLFVIILHNVLEGIITINLGIKLFLGIFLHNIPEGLILATLIFNKNKKIGITLLITLLSGFQELFGSLLAYFVLMPYMNSFVISMFYSIVAGIMLYLSFKSTIEYIKLKQSDVKCIED